MTKTVDLRDVTLAGSRGNLFIDGQERSASDGSTFDVLDPATGVAFVSVANGTAVDAGSAIDAAARAAEPWAATAPRVRAEILRATFELMIASRAELTALIVRENGKAWNEA